MWDLRVVALLAACLPSVVAAQPASLKTVRIPTPDNLVTFVRNEGAAIALGKAFFWDMQVGSDGIQACASCHFHAGADNRVKNQINPGTMHQGTQFQVVGPNGTLKASDFPFHRLSDPSSRASAVLSDTDDVVSSQGVFRANFRDVVPGRAEEVCDPVFDPVWNVGGKNVRRVEPRNTPSVINAVFNFRNFWDGRASVRFNGVNPFGPRDPGARVLQVQANGSVIPVALSINRASLASQAVGPVVSGTEMACEGRTFPKVGKKLLTLTPLGRQLVDPSDSVLGVLANSALTPGTPGLRVSYAALIQEAFQPAWWSSDRIVTFSGGVPVVSSQTGTPQTTDQFTLMEANFSLFWGLAVQLYEAMLISDDTPFDRFREGDASALTAQQQQGLQLFLDTNTVRCINHHRTSLFTGAAFPANPDIGGEEPIQLMGMPAGSANYDGGFYNLGARPTAEDPGVGGEAPAGQPLAFGRRVQRRMDVSELAGVFTPDPIAPGDLVIVDGAAKVPGLRNVELTFPYMHNGGMFTLEQVVDFYARGGDFTEANFPDIDPDMKQITGLDTPAKKAAMAAFLRSLTDDRVRFEDPPFDHPQLFVPNGHRGDATSVVDDGTGKAADDLLEIAAVGAPGRCVSIDGRTRPCCGDAIVQSTEQCDGSADAACPGQCQADCFCAGRAPAIGEILADAAVVSGSPNTNFGTAVVLQVDASSAKQSLIRVRVRGVGSRRVSNAVLHLQVAAASASGGRIHPITSCGWAERSVTWNTRPTIDGPVLATVGAVAVNQRVDFDVTAAIPRDGDYCFALDSLSSDNVEYNSREAPTGRPTFTVTAAGATRCGDNALDPGEQCDGTAAAACPGACRADCTCPPRCGDGQVNQVGEECDGAADVVCPGRCQADCRCGTPPPTTALDLAPIADTYIEKGTEGTWDHGAAPHLDVDLSPRGIAYLKFDLRGVAATVTRATLTLHCINNAADGGTIRMVGDSSWVEGTGNGVDASSANGPGLKWVDVDTNRDGFIDTTDTSPWVPDPTRAVGVLGRVVSGQDHTVDVTSALQGGARLYTLAIQNNDTDGATYSSRTATTAAFRPRLHLELASAPGTTTTTTTLPGGTTTTHASTTTTSTTTTTAASTTSTTLVAGTPFDLAPVADTYIEFGAESTWDHGASDHMDVDDDPKGISYLKFDLRGVSARITSAVLLLSCTNKSTQGGTIFPVLNSSWVEGDRTGVDATSVNGPGLKWIDVDTNRDGSVNASDAPPFVPDFAHPLGSLGAVVAGQQHSVDVTAAFQSGPGFYSLAIRNNTGDGATFASRQDATAARRPVLRLTLAAEPAACAGAVVIPPGGGTFGGTTTGESSLDGSCGGLGSPERVFRWTPGISGTATIMTCGASTTFDTTLYVRQGSCGGAQLVCNDDTTGCAVADGTDNASDHGSRITTAVTAGTSYFIVVDGFQGTSGPFALTVIPPS